MAGDDMAPKLVAQTESAFKVELRSLTPASGGGFGNCLARHVDREPVVALVDHGQTDARAGDRRAEVDGIEVVTGANDQPEIAALLGAPDGADVGDDPGEHPPRLIPRRALVNFEPVDTETLIVDEPPAVVRIGDGIEADITEARLALSDDDWRAIDQDPVDQIFAEEGGCGGRPAFD